MRDAFQLLADAKKSPAGQVIARECGIGTRSYWRQLDSVYRKLARQDRLGLNDGAQKQETAE